MSFSFRKRFKLGPWRMNLSKSGIGLSADTGPVNIGMNSNGPYLSGGAHGVYYRKHFRSGAATSTGAMSPQTSKALAFLFLCLIGSLVVVAGFMIWIWWKFLFS